MNHRTRLLAGAGCSLALHTIVLAALPGGSARSRQSERAGVRSHAIPVAVLSAERAREILEPARRRVPPRLAEPPARAEETIAPIEVPGSVRAIPGLRPLAWSPPVAARPAPHVLLDEGDAPRAAPEVLTAPPPSWPRASAEPAPPTPPPPTRPPSDLASLEGIVLSRPPLAYPPVALRRGIEGRVRVGLRVDDDGRVTATWILDSSGSALLDRAARNNLSGWRLDPVRLARLGARRFRQEVRFELR